MFVDKEAADKYLKVASIVLLVLASLLAMKVSYLYGFKHGQENCIEYYEDYQDAYCTCYEPIGCGEINFTQALENLNIKKIKKLPSPEYGD